jgi:alkanesulfonate monooxygenase SsuD/methylene tetrahydromethanopterin reductase-like flavin-dependent oxidoreductase (luciferase family)
VLRNCHPVALAKRVATIDALSGGRLRLCVGIGWLKEEIEACATEIVSRGRRADEQIEVMRLLWGQRPDGASYRGEFFGFDHAACYPTVAHVSIHIGGHSRAAARRADRFGDGFQPLGIGGSELTDLIAVMRDEASKVGRDRDALELSPGHLVTKIDADCADRLATLGVDRVVLTIPPTTDIVEFRDLLSACAQRLALIPWP